MPLVLPMVAIDGVWLIHVPPPEAPVGVIVEPTQTDNVPDIVGKAFTVTMIERVQLVPICVAVMVTVEAVPPATNIPVLEPMVAIVVLLLLQVTALSFVIVIVPNAHTWVGPPMVAALAVTVITLVA
jgi:hypothetical protein